MSTISDDDLILYHYRDGLAPARLAQIATALAAEPALARRYRALQRLLGAVDAEAMPAPDADFEQRLWSRLQLRMAAAADSPAHAGSTASTAIPAASPTAAIAPAMPPAHGRRAWRPRRRTLLAVGAACAAVLALALVLPLGLPFKTYRRPATPAAARVPALAQGPATVTPAAADDAWQAASDRILVAQLAQHLHRTRAVLQSVARTDGAALLPRDDGYLRVVAQDNRLYAAAAERRGIRALAGFLRSLDPLLLALAQRSGAVAGNDEDLRRLVREGDLLFRLHAAHARLLARESGRA